MAITLLQAQDLVGLLHAGTIGPRLWADFLQALKLRIGATEAVLALGARGVSSNILIQRAGHSPVPSNDPLWSALFNQAGASGAASLRPRRVYAEYEYRDAASGAQLAVLNRFAEGAGTTRMRAMWLGDGAGAILWILLGRRGENFTVADGAMLTELGDHLKTALATWAALSCSERSAKASSGALARRGHTWVRLDRAGYVVDRAIDAAAEPTDAFRITSAGRFIPRAPADQEALAAFLATLGSDQIAESPPSMILPVSQMLLRIEQGFSDADYDLFVYHRSHTPDTAALIEVLRQTYSLSNKEARLAVLLTEGVSLADAASELDLTLESTRLYSKRLFAKTGTKGQVDLVRTILSSPIALA